MLELLADIEEARRLLHCGLRRGVFALGSGQPVEALHDGDHQSAARNFGPGTRQRFRCDGPAVVCKLAEANRFVSIPLAHVFMNCVVRNIASGGRAIALSVEILIVVGDVGQQASPRLHAVFVRDRCVGEGAQELRSIVARAREGVLQSERQWRGGLLRVGLCTGNSRKKQGGDKDMSEHITS